MKTAKLKALGRDGTVVLSRPSVSVDVPANRFVRTFANRVGTFSASALVAGDPEIDLDRIGGEIGSTSRVWLTEAGLPAIDPVLTAHVFDEQGSEVSSGPWQDFPPTFAGLRAGGRKVPIDAAVKRYVFRRAYQVQHTDGAGFDLFFNLAQELEGSGSMLRVLSTETEDGRIRMGINGIPSYGFLSGRVQGDKYQLVLHLASQRLPLTKAAEVIDNEGCCSPVIGKEEPCESFRTSGVKSAGRSAASSSTSTPVEESGTAEPSSELVIPGGSFTAPEERESPGAVGDAPSVSGPCKPSSPNKASAEVTLPPDKRAAEEFARQIKLEGVTTYLTDKEKLRFREVKEDDVKTLRGLNWSRDIRLYPWGGFIFLWDVGLIVRLYWGRERPWSAWFRGGILTHAPSLTKLMAQFEEIYTKGARE